ncbi:MAG: hypothetical protein LBD57_00095 [Endomicrobium sp.]|jgi:hypothetical protein|uniref:hypothetical protein n=1 Tax=Candidatus Endomicrobiellum cubanum TaxID=3242325 RepID=UPI00282B5E29|nr:hypothetical protein [Endomicrobium sp.]
MIFKNSYWLQFSGKDHAVRIKKLLYPDFIPENKKNFKKMDRRELLNIFPQDKTIKSRINRLIDQILERRDMLINTCQK